MLIILMFILSTTLAWLLLNQFDLTGITRYMRSRVARFKMSTEASRARGQWPDALLLMAGALQTGLTLEQALNLLIRETPEPLRAQLANQMGALSDEVPFRQKVERLMRGTDLSLARAALLMARDSGGRAANLLKRSATLMRQNLEMAEKIKTLTAQSHLTAWVVGLSPFGLLMLMAFFSPEVMTPLFTTRAGWAYLGVIVGLVTTGLIVVHRMMRIEGA